MNKFKKLEKLFKEKDKIGELVSDNLKTVKARFKDRQHKVIRGGKEAMAKEKDLWTEIWELGTNKNEASKIMRKQYPDLFILADKDVKLAKEIENFTLINFGFNLKAMTLSDYIKITRELIRVEIVKLNYIAKIIGVITIVIILGYLIRGIF